MTPQVILEQTLADFRPSSDQKAFGRKEAWRIHKGDGPFGADCEDFALTLLWRLVGGNEARFWETLRTGEAKIIHVLSDRGNDHVALWLKGVGYVDNLKPAWRDDLGYEDRGTYSVKAIRQKLAGKDVQAPDDAKKSRKMLIIAGLLGAAAVMMMLGEFKL